jgi:hypothetical protein
MEKGIFAKKKFWEMETNQGMKMGGRENPSGVIDD